MGLIHSNSPGFAKGREKMKMKCWQWVENFGSTNTGVLDERKFTGSGSKVLDHKGKKNGLRKKGIEKNICKQP